MTGKSQSLPSLNIRLPVYSVRGITGFSIGVYVTTYALLILESLTQINAGAAVAVFGLRLYPLQWVGFCIAGGILLIALLEVPTGILADSLGRKFAVVMSVGCRSVVFVFLWLICREAASANPQAHLIILYALGFELAAGFASAFFSGSFLAWVVDSLEAEGKGPLRAFIIARSWVYYWALLILGSLLGIGSKLADFIQYSYIVGFFLESGLAVFLWFTMQENVQYQFASASQVFSTKYRKVFTEVAEVWKKGIKILIKTPELWFVFITAAALRAVLNVVTWLWPVIGKSRFPGQLQQFSKEWVILVLAFSCCTLIGNYLLSNWLNSKRGVGGAHVVWLTMIVNLIAMIPIVFIAVVMSLQDTPFAQLYVFLVAIAAFQFFKGGLLSMTDTIQNEFIAANTKERSTVLSLGGIIQNGVGAILVFYGVGSTTTNLVWWLLPALVLVGMTLLQTFVCLRKLAS